MSVKAADPPHPGLLRNRKLYFYLIILFVLITGAVISWNIYKKFESLDGQRVEIEFSSQARHLVQTIQVSLKKKFVAIQATKHFLEVIPNIEPQSFAAFGEYIIASNPDIYNLEWAAKVDEDQRQHFEAEVQEKYGLTSFKISELDPSGNLKEADPRRDYNPILFWASKQDQKSMIGFDYGSEPHARDALTLARRTGNATATSLMSLSKFHQIDQENSEGFLVFSPVFRLAAGVNGGSSSTELAGYVVATFNIHSILSYALKYQDTTNLRFEVHADDSRRPAAGVLYEEQGPVKIEMKKSFLRRIFRNPYLPSDLTLEETFLVAGQRWKIRCSAADNYFISKENTETKVILIIGFLITILAATYIFMIEQRRTQEIILQMSMMDELTNLYNRRGFLRLAEKQIRHARWHKKRMLLIQADLDYLKKINDQYGHAAGDRAISEAGKLLRSLFRHSDIVGRLGGDEFAALLLDVTKLTPAMVMENLKNQMSVLNFNSGLAYKIRVSVGIAAFEPRNPSSLQDLLNRADRELYKQKQVRPPFLS